MAEHDLNREQPYRLRLAQWQPAQRDWSTLLSVQVDAYALVGYLVAAAETVSADDPAAREHFRRLLVTTAEEVGETAPTRLMPGHDAHGDEALALLRELWDDAYETRTIGSYRVTIESEQAARINRVLAAQHQEHAAAGAAGGQTGGRNGNQQD